MCDDEVESAFMSSTLMRWWSFREFKSHISIYILSYIIILLKRKEKGGTLGLAVQAQ